MKIYERLILNGVIILAVMFIYISIVTVIEGKYLASGISFLFFIEFLYGYIWLFNRYEKGDLNRLEKLNLK